MKDVEDIIESLDDVPFEEWLRYFAIEFTSRPNTARRVLIHISRCHLDSEWRFNAIQILLDRQLLTDEEI